MARLTGLEPATPGVTGRYSNQLSYNRSRRPGLAGSGRLIFGPAGGVNTPSRGKFDETRLPSRRVSAAGPRPI